MQVSAPRLFVRALAAAALLAPLLALRKPPFSICRALSPCSGPTGSVRALAERSDVFVGDVISTERDSYAQLRFTDGGQVTLRPSTQVKIDAYGYDEGRPERDKLRDAAFQGRAALPHRVDRQAHDQSQRLQDGDLDRHHRHPRHRLFGDRHPRARARPERAPEPAPARGVRHGGRRADRARLGGVEQLVGVGQVGFSSNVNLPPGLVPRLRTFRRSPAAHLRANSEGRAASTPARTWSAWSSKA